jgi:hypothetical protein
MKFLHTYPSMKMEQSVPKCWHIKFRRREITSKKAYNIQNTAKVWNQEYSYLLVLNTDFNPVIRRAGIQHNFLVYSKGQRYILEIRWQDKTETVDTNLQGIRWLRQPEKWNLLQRHTILEHPHKLAVWLQDESETDKQTKTRQATFWLISGKYRVFHNVLRDYKYL